MNHQRVYVQLRDFQKALNADVVKKARARGTSPPWIKEFAGQLEDPEYVELTLAERGFLHDLRLLALRRGNKILVDEHYLRVQLRCSPRTLCVPKVDRLRALGFLEPYNEATNEAANQLLPSRIDLEHRQNDSRLEVEGEVEDPPNPPSQGGQSTTSTTAPPRGRRRAQPHSEKTRATDWMAKARELYERTGDREQVADWLAGLPSLSTAERERMLEVAMGEPDLGEVVA